MKTSLTFIFAVILASHQAFPQNKEKYRPSDYFVFQTGLMYNNFNSLGIRTGFEYEQELTQNWLYGISYENTRHIASAPFDREPPFSEEYSDQPANLSLLNINGYYKIPLWEDKIYWTAGIGLGGVHAYWDGQDRFGLTLNVTAELSLKLSKKIYLETAPLLVFPPVNRLYMTPHQVGNRDIFGAMTLFPVGVKVKM